MARTYRSLPERLLCVAHDEKESRHPEYEACAPSFANYGDRFTLVANPHVGDQVNKVRLCVNDLTNLRQALFEAVLNDDKTERAEEFFWCR